MTRPLSFQKEPRVPNNRDPISFDLTIQQLAEMLARKYMEDGEEKTAFEVGMRAGEELLGVRFSIAIRPISGLNELLPAQPRH